MKTLNLDEDTQAKLREIADSYIQSFIYPRIPDPQFKRELVSQFVECFEEGSSNSPVYLSSDVRVKAMGWVLDKRNLLNEYWVDTINYGLIKVWGKNKTSVRKHLRTHGHGKVLTIVLVKEFNRTEFLEENLK